MSLSEPSTMRDIAKLAGVSVMSVSRAVRNQPGLSASTRRKILNAVERHGYKPNSFVSTLMTHVRRQTPISQRATLAFIVPSRKDFESAYGYREYFAGASERGAKLGLKIDRFYFEEVNSNPRRLSDILRASGIRGVLLNSFPFSSPVFQMNWDPFCLATIGYALLNPALHRATSDHCHMMQMATEKLVAAKYRRIGFYTLNRFDDLTHQYWTSAFLYYQHQCRASDRVPLLLIKTEDKQAFVRWFQRYKPDAIITKHIEVLDWLKAIGANTPNVGFVHLDWIPEFGDASGINQNLHLVAAAAVDLVVEQFHWNECGVPPNPKAVIIQESWVQGATVRKSF
jgi:LacI family transcriptional regulator